MNPCSRCGAPTNSDGSCTQGACRADGERTPPAPVGQSGNRALARDIMARIAQLPQLQKVFADLPPVEAVSGFACEQDTWIRLVGHIPTYRLLCDIEDLIWDALPDVMRDLVRSARDC